MKATELKRGEFVTSPPYWKGFANEAYLNSYAQYLRRSKKWMNRDCKRVQNTLNGTLKLNVIKDSEMSGKSL